MTNLLAARSQMAVSLGFHIIFAAVGIAMPLLMVVAEGMWLKSKDEVYLDLAKRWAKGTAILFVVGAVSGTVLSFELGLLWPTFMAYAGPIIGMPFSLEGLAFFIEAIFLGIYLYGWNKVSPVAHWLAGFLVLIGGTLSGIFVVTVNAWMNTPAGFDWQGGHATHIHPFAAMTNPAALTQTIHMTIAAFQAVGFAVAGIHAYMLRKDPSDLFHRRAFAISLAIGSTMALLQPLSGDFLAKQVARNQVVKLAAMEGQWETEKGAPLRLGGWPDDHAEKTRFALDIPYGLSLLAYGHLHAEVRGMKDVLPQNRPPVVIVHIAFQIMVAAGSFLMMVALLAAGLAWKKRRVPDEPWFLTVVMLSAPLGVVAIEAGWTVTEVGRQPWVIYNIMRTADAVTPMPGLIIPFSIFTTIYVFLAFTVVALLRVQVFASSKRNAR